MLILRLLNKLLEDVQQIKRPYFVQVEMACMVGLKDIRAVEAGASEKILRQKSLEYEESEEGGRGLDSQDTNLDLLAGEETRPQVSVDSEKFFIPFELACKGDVAKLTITALDAIQKLVAYGDLIGDFPDPKAPSRRLIDRIVETICECHTNVMFEGHDGVELQIIKALLTIVTSEHVQVHDSTLLLILRTVCIIHLTTKSVVNKRTAKAMLTQMLHSIFHRMEIAKEELEVLPNGKLSRCQSVDVSVALEDWGNECIKLVENSLSDSILSVSSDFLHSSAIPLEDPTTTNTNTVQSDSESSFANFETANFDQGQDNEPVRDISDIDINQNTGKTIEDFGRNEMDADNVLVRNESFENEENSKNPFLQRDSEEPEKRLSIQSFQGNNNNSNVSILQKDAFLSFWTLAKLALKPLSKPDAEHEMDKAALEVKFQQAILAFHLLKEVLEKSGKVFKDSAIFNNAMRQHLVHALTKNGISTNPEIFSLEVDIIMIILRKFSEVLSPELKNLLDDILFPVLESPSTYPPDYFKIVLKSLKEISTNLDCFVHMFCSYDQDIESHSKPFKKTANYLNKIICDKLGQEQLAVEIIANMLKSMSSACPKPVDENSNNNHIEGGGNGSGSDCEKLRRFSSFEEPLKFDDDGIQNLELEGKDFLTCLHIFLGHLEVPSDVFKIDWSVQKLAQRMTDTSSVNSFKTETADCWYALIYASMSLIADIRITDYQGKSKMSKSQFLKLNRAINGCEPLDESLISSIYDEIEDNYRRNSEGDVKGSKVVKWLASSSPSSPTSPSSSSSSVKGKSEQEILDVIKYILESTSLLRSHFSLGKQLKHVKRMIKICSTSFLIALITALQNTNDTKLSDVCLEGIHSGIRVACILGLDSERETYVQALSKLSLQALDDIQRKHINKKIVTTTTSTLTMTENGVTKTVVTTTTEMKCRSVDIILTLLDVGIAEGNHLGGSWLHILKFISQLLSTSLLRVDSSRGSSRSGSPVPPHPPVTSPGSGGGGGSTANHTGSSSGSSWSAWLRESLEKKLWDPSATSLDPSVKESIANSVEKVFKRSELLTGDAMTEFFQALCQVSLHDMMNSETPRHLMYEKINEVADGNFYRPALQWSQIWQVVADYFCHLACSSKEEISQLAISSIEKLVLKLLKKETLNGYRFQNHYFSPFKVIITNTRSQSTRDSVLGFIETVISLHGDLLLSGWIAILDILVANMLSDKKDNGSSSAVADSFRVLQHIVDKCLKDEVNLRNSFGSIVKTLIDIAANIAPSLEMSEQAFRLLTQMAEIPYRHPQLLMEENDDKMYRVWARGWKPILSELSTIICSGKEVSGITVNSDLGSGSPSSRIQLSGNILPSWDIKTKALITLFEVIKSYGGAFEREWWNSVFEVLFTIFSHIKSHEKQDLMFAIFDVYIQYYDSTTEYVFDELLRHLQWCICQDHEQIALSGVSCLQQLVVALGKRFIVERWDSILNLFQTMTMCMTQPQLEVETPKKKKNGVMHAEDIIASARNDCQNEIFQAPAIQAVVHLELLKIIDRIVFPGGRTSPHGSIDDLNEEQEQQPTPKTTTIAVSNVEVNPTLSDDQITIILDILDRSHEKAKEHCIRAMNCEQQAATFIPHETLSLQIYWKILFALLKTDRDHDSDPVNLDKDTLWTLIQQSCTRSCAYFVTISLREHRDAWADLLCFAMTNIISLPRPNFEKITSQLYPYFCDMMEVDLLDSRICDKLKEYLLIVGKDYGVFTVNVNEEEIILSTLANQENDMINKTLQQYNSISDALNENYLNESKDFQ